MMKFRFARGFWYHNQEYSTRAFQYRRNKVLQLGPWNKITKKLRAGRLALTMEGKLSLSFYRGRPKTWSIFPTVRFCQCFTDSLSLLFSYPHVLLVNGQIGLNVRQGVVSMSKNDFEFWTENMQTGKSFIYLEVSMNQRHAPSFASISMKMLPNFLTIIKRESCNTIWTHIPHLNVTRTISRVQK